MESRDCGRTPGPTSAFWRSCTEENAACRSVDSARRDLIQRWGGPDCAAAADLHRSCPPPVRVSRRAIRHRAPGSERRGSVPREAPRAVAPREGCHRPQARLRLAECRSPRERGPPGSDRAPVDSLAPIGRTHPSRRPRIPLLNYLLPRALPGCYRRYDVAGSGTGNGDWREGFRVRKALSVNLRPSIAPASPFSR